MTGLTYKGWQMRINPAASELWRWEAEKGNLHIAAPHQEGCEATIDFLEGLPNAEKYIEGYRDRSRFSTN